MLQSIEQELNKIRIIDGHEHLFTSNMREKGKMGFFGLLHYLDSDMITAGMKRGVLDKLSPLSDEEKAALFLRYWNRTSNTTYARMFKTGMEDLYGFHDWSVEGILKLDQQIIEKSLDPSWYYTVLKEKSGIDMALTLIQTTKVDFGLFRPVMFMDFTYRISAWNDIEIVFQGAGKAVRDLSSYLEVIEALFDQYVQEGMVATKLGHAYWRSLECGKSTYSEAESVFNRLASMSSKEALQPEEIRPLQDYLIRYIIQQSAVRQLPIQIHTGHHETSVSGDGNIITNSKVTDLIPLFLDYTDARFVLLHMGLPYHDEYLSIAKNFSNVYADMTWVYIISPSASKQILHQMIEMVPQCKVLAFGGDYNFVEGTYAHQKLARKLLAEVLSEKVVDGVMQETEAVHYANLVFRDNLIDLYDLKI
jgi:hypothetical protein